MKLRFGLFRLIVMVSLILAILSPSHAASTGDHLSIGELWDGQSIVSFIVDTSYEDIIGFAVGNKYGYEYSSTTVAGWESYVAVRDPQGWKIPIKMDDPGPIGLPSIELKTFSELNIGFDLNDAGDAFSEYYRAFIFFGTSPLPAGTTDGFFGLAFGQDSIFAAFRDTDSGDPMIIGEANSLPLPGAALLLLSGLTGLIGIQRRNKV